MARRCKHTSKPVAKIASSIFRNGRYGKGIKSVATSALTQTKKHK